MVHPWLGGTQLEKRPIGWPSWLAVGICQKPVDRIYGFGRSVQDICRVHEHSEFGVLGAGRLLGVLHI